MTTSPLIPLFKEQFENESRAIEIERSLTKRGDNLCWWYFRRLMGFDDATIEEVYCDGFNDLGVDAIWIADEGAVHFYQFKNPESIDAGFPGGDIDKILSGLQLILSRKHEKIANEELRGRVEEIYQTIPTGYRLHIVTSGSGLSIEATTKLDSFVSGLQGSDGFFSWECEDIRWLQDRFYQKTLPTVESPLELSLDQPPYPVRSANHDCWMFHIASTTLAELYEHHGEQLLQQNIRVYEGDKGTNAAILRTCSGEESANFLHYNNGVTFLADTAPWDAFTRRLTLNRAQVVNGGQTVRVINFAWKKGSLKNDVLIPVRVITSQGDKSFASNVAVNLNNQNRVEPSFLRSNDPHILQLSSALVSIGWYLERREREVEGLTATERGVIENKIGRSLENAVIPLKDAAQAYVATYMRQPELAKKNPKRIFQGFYEGGLFEKIFSADLTAERFLLGYRLSLSINGYIKQFMTRKRRRDRHHDWKADYRSLLGAEIVDEFAGVVDQVVQQSAVFLSALAFEEWARLRGKDVGELVTSLERGEFDLLNQLLLAILKYAEGQKALGKSWPTLLKSQSFFENVASYLKGRVEGQTSNVRAPKKASRIPKRAG